MNLVIRICLLSCWYMAVAVLGGIIFVNARNLVGEVSCHSTHLEWPRRRYQLDYVSTEDSALEILDYIRANCDGKLFAIGGVSLGGQIAMELLSIERDIAEKAIIDGSLCIPQPRLAKISIFLIRLFGKLMFSKFSCKLQLSMMNKLYPKLAYPEEIKDYYLEDLPRTPIKNISDHL